MNALGRETALVLLLNRKFIRPVRVLLYSISLQPSLRDCPIVVLTDDLLVTKDRFLNRVAHNVEYLDESTLSLFTTVQHSPNNPRRSTGYAPDFTFTKFAIFRPRGFERHIFLDADMLCLNAVDPEILSSDFDVKAVHEIGGAMFPIRDESRDKFSFEKAMSYIENNSVPHSGGPIEQINSGFLTIQGAALGEEMFMKAIDLASREAFSSEQRAMTALFRQEAEGDLKYMRAPLWYNARRRMFECLGAEQFERYRDQIVFLHYTPGKPWSIAAHLKGFLDDVWFDYQHRSQEWVNDTISTMT